jgi:hypothetical protein
VPRSLAARVVLGLLTVALVTCGSNEDQVLCEEAVARLAHCCPGFDASLVDCAYPCASDQFGTRGPTRNLSAFGSRPAQ